MGGGGQVIVTDISNSPSDMGLSNSSLPLGASATALFDSIRNPQFTSLMDSFRDIADTNSWEKLDPSQIQGLVDSFKVGEQDKFGLEPEIYAELHASFNQFLSQLNNRFLTGSSNTTPRLSEYSRHHHNSSVVASNDVMGGVNGRGLLSRFRPHHHQLDVVSPLISMHHLSSSGYDPNRTPSPVAQQGQLPSGSNSNTHHQYGGYVSANRVPPVTGSEGGVAIRSAATDLFDDDDDFDWSKLM